MKRTIIVRVVASCAIAVICIGTWFSSGYVDLGPLRYFSAAVLTAMIALGLWDLWLWRIRVAQRLPGVSRSVRGTWKGTIKSLWIEPGDDKPVEPKTVFLVIRQTASLVSLKLLTEESESSSTLANVSVPHGTAVLEYLYMNSPRMSVEARSRIHRGSAVLDIAGNPARRLAGRYWTDRDSKGEIAFSERSRKIAEDFEEATELFETKAGG